MKEKNIEQVIAESIGVERGFLPLDIFLIEGKPFTDKKKEKSTAAKPIIISSINYKGTARKVPYAPISTVFTVDF